MEERLLNEKESLELITQMINSSKKNMEIGQGITSWCGVISQLPCRSFCLH